MTESNQSPDLISDPVRSCSEAPPITPSAPPTTPGLIPLVARRSVWPIPIGVVVIAACAWTLISALGQVAQGFALPMFAAMPGANAGSSDIAGVFSELMPYIIASSSMLAIAAALGIAGGIMLLCRKRSSVLVLRSFALWKIPTSAAYAGTKTALMSKMMAVSTQVSASGPTPPAAPTAAMMTSMSYFTSAYYFFIGCVVPVFILIWLALPHVKSTYRKW